jgi:hypothetical protein
MPQRTENEATSDDVGPLPNPATRQPYNAWEDIYLNKFIQSSLDLKSRPPKQFPLGSRDPNVGTKTSRR